MTGIVDIKDKKALEFINGFWVNPRSGSVYESPKGIPNLIDKKYLEGNNLRQYRSQPWIFMGRDLSELLGKWFFQKPTHPLTYQRAVEELEIRSRDRVLVVSIGSGTFLKNLLAKLYRKNANIIGMDLSLDLLSCCDSNLRKWGLNADLIQACPENIPYPNAYFNRVICLKSVDSFFNPNKVMEELNRVCMSEEGVEVFKI